MCDSSNGTVEVKNYFCVVFLCVLPLFITYHRPSPKPHGTDSTRMSCLTTNSFSTSTSSTIPISIGANSSAESPLDSFISGIISAVTIDESSKLCSNCEEGATAFSKCMDCSEQLCDGCVRAHQRVRLTKDHRISRFDGSTNNSSISPQNNGLNGI
ncbi:unnamed protein product [Callosobruchus maculatus]|nr:unnamed protein product [Callosobruchus maculatus]